MDINELLNNTIDNYWSWRLLDIPEFATFVGEHKHDDRLMDMSLNGYLRRRDDAKTWLAEAHKIRKLAEETPPSNGCQIHLDYLQHDTETFLEGLTHQTYLCPLNPTDGPHIKFPRLLSWMPKDTTEGQENIKRRLRQFSIQIDQMIELMKEGIRLEKTVAINVVECYPPMLLEFCNRQKEESTLFQPFQDKPTKLSDEKWSNFADNVNHLLTTLVLPAYERLAIFIRDVYMPETKPGPGLPPEVYESYVRFHTDGATTAKEIFDLGMEKLEMLKPKLEEQQKKVGFEGTQREFIEYLRTDPKFSFSSREEMMEVYEKESERVYSLLPKVFSKLPKMSYKVVPAPVEIEKHYCVGAYVAGDVEKDRPGLFILNTYSPKSRKKYDVSGIILHEALPGHHIQLALAAESDLRDYRRFADELRYWDLPAHVGMKSAYHEGWATYAEHIGHDLGLYDDVYDHIGSISREIELACRYVVDVGLHLYGWSREKAYQFMLDNCCCDELELRNEVFRYMFLPGQALCYLFGKDKFLEYRKKAEESLGERFNVGEFHTMLCSLGDVPMFIVEGQVDNFIADRIEKAA